MKHDYRANHQRLLLDDERRRAQIGAAARDLAVSGYALDAIGERLKQYFGVVAKSFTA